MEYDWAWRKDGPMTFAKLLYEGAETCSDELYLRRVYARALVQEHYLFGLMPGVLHSNRREEFKLWDRLIEINFVRAYLHERRSGLKPRQPGPSPGWQDRRDEATVDALNAHQRSLKAVITTVVAPPDPCCDFMRSQPNSECGLDILIKRGSSGYTYCLATNATYICNYCPVCGTKQPKTDEEVGE